MVRSLRRWGLVAAVFALVVAACSSASTDDGETASTTAPPTTTAAPATTTIPPTTIPPTTTTEADAGSEAVGIDFIVEFASTFVESGGEAYDYVEVTDDTGRFTVEVPSQWSNVDGEPWDEGIVGPGIEASVNAAADLDAFYNGFTAPAILIGAATKFAPDVAEVTPAAEWDFSADCTNEGVVAYRDVDTNSDGFFMLWSDCGDTGAVLLISAATEPGGEYATVALGMALTQADVDAYANALATAEVDTAEGVDAAGVVGIVGEFAAPADSVPDYTYESVEDDTGTIVVSVPTTWADRDPSEGGNYVSIATAPDLAAFNDDWAEPGLWVARFSASGSLFVPDGDFNYGDECTYEGRYPYVDAVASGQFEIWSECGGTDTTLLVLQAFRDGEDMPNMLLFQLPSEAELSVLQEALDTFGVAR